MRMLFSLSVIAVVTFSFVVQAANPQLAFDVNDVSFIFPLHARKPYPVISLAQHQLLSPGLFEQILRFENKTAPISSLPYLDSAFIGDMQAWHVTSFRFEPCGEVFRVQGEIAAREPGCQARLRVVIQPFNLLGNPLTTAIHLLYRYQEPEVLLVTAILSRIKDTGRTVGRVETTGQPLMLHPALTEELKLTGPRVMASEIENGFLEILNLGQSTHGSPLTSPADRLEIATLILQVEIDHWKFLGGYVRGNKWTRFVTEFNHQFFDPKDLSVQLGVEDLTCNRHSVCRLQPNLLPTSLFPQGFTINDIFSGTPDGDDLQIPGYRDDRIHKLAEQIDDPLQTHFFNTNCVSCHQSSNLRDRSALHSTFPNPSGITPFVPLKHLDGHTNNVINFGYWGSSPRISARTASESAKVADALNQSRGLKNPAKPILDLKSFWKCLVSEADYKQCI